MSRGRTHTSALTRCKAASQSSRRRKTSRRVLKPCKGAQNNVLERERWYSRKAALSCVALHVLPGSPALLVIGLRPTLRTGFCEALVLGLKRFVGRSWVQNVTVKTAFRSHWLRVGVRSSLLHQKCGRALYTDAATQDRL